jgi:hypothetical protein
MVQIDRLDYGLYHMSMMADGKPPPILDDVTTCVRFQSCFFAVFALAIFLTVPAHFT